MSRDPPQHLIRSPNRQLQEILRQDQPQKQAHHLKVIFHLRLRKRVQAVPTRHLQKVEVMDHQGRK